VSSSSFLCELHKTVFEVAQLHSANVFDFAEPGVMVFHSTLAHALPEGRIPEAMQIIRETGFPKQGTVTNAALVEYFPANELWSYPL